MGLIAAVEDAVLAEVAATLGGTVRKTGSLPGGWSVDSLQRALQFSPGVYVAFQGMTPGAGSEYHHGRFSCYVVSKGAAEADRRRGNARVIGAYDMLERLLPRLANLAVPDVGTLKLRGVDNLFRETLIELGGTVYGINLELPNMPFDYTADLATLDDFVTFDVVHDLDTTQDSEPLAEDHVTGLDQL